MMRNQVISELLSKARSFIFDEMNQPMLGDGEREELFNLMTKIGHLTKDLAAAELENDAQTLAIEYDRIRPLLVEIKRFGLRHHLTLAQPLWGWPAIQLNPSAVAYVGGEDLLRAAVRICKGRRLTVITRNPDWGAGDQRWNQMRTAPVGIFDLRETSSQVGGASAYALGFALALGIAPVIVVNKGQALPFNIDIEPVSLDGSSNDDLALGTALDRAFYSFSSIRDESSVLKTLRKVADCTTGGNATTEVFKKRIDQGLIDDPIEAQSVARLLVASSKLRQKALITPIWSGDYPDSGTPRCFHIMPFSQGWSDSVRETVRDACEQQQVSYRRGDESEKQRVIFAIWNEIGRANFVIVDLSGLNTNVCLEMGLAHALGRRTLLLRRADQDEPLFPEISKLQIPFYRDEELKQKVKGFLTSAEEN
ncbi:MAG: hypothetical protein KJP23_31670 [Deltaproteobacteria bacterium]|nr:hypothetical protein [Deltaproteobacteria bacterium]